jgi:RHS repeat-associated protein
MRKILLILLLLQQIYVVAQITVEITGPTTANVGETKNYTLMWRDGFYLTLPPMGGTASWYAIGGTVTYGDEGSGSVQWNAAGPRSVFFEYSTWNDYYFDDLMVTVSGGVPSAPTATAATSVATTSFTANWGSVSGATSYRLDVSPVSNFASYVSGFQNLSVTTTNRSVTGLTAGTTYYYRVRAVNSSGTSANSNTITTYTVTSAPNATAATSITTSSFTANWGSVTGASSYRLDVSTVSNFSSYVPGYQNLSVTGTNRSVTGLTAGTTYYYRVRAINAGGLASANSGTITAATAIPVPATPAATSATSVATTSFTANWTAVTGATSYQLDVSQVSNFSTYVSGFQNLSVTTTTRSVTGLTAGTTYYYRVRAVNSSGTSANSNTITTYTVTSAPNATAATSITSSSFTANWGSVTGASSYRLDVSTVSNFSSYVPGYQNLSVTGTNRSVTGLSAGTTYYYRVRAVNAGGLASSNSGTITAVTTTVAPTTTAPTAVTATSFTATWNSVAGAASYRLDVSQDNFASYVSGSQNLTVTGTSQVVSGLQPSITYQYRVRSVNSAGVASSNSGTQTVTTYILNYNHNFIRTVVALKEGITTDTELENSPMSDKQVTYQFFDGLGRPSQTVAVQQSPNQQDIVQPIAYDAFGREAVKYLPYVSGSDGSFKTNFYPKDDIANYSTASNAQYQFYQNTPKVAIDAKPFSETIFEPSPLNRPDKDFGPGADWHNNNRHIKHGYLINSHGTGSSQTQEKIIAWMINGSNLPVRTTPLVTGYIVTGGYYATGQLQIKSIKDEHGNEVREYTNKSGQVILKKVQATAAGASNLNDLTGTTPGWALTYYIYDDFGNLRFVLPPELSKLIHQNDATSYNPSTTELNNWAFQYKYDGRKRMIEKQVPGAKPVYMVYDKRDRLVMTQDGNQRAGTTKYWSFSKYDALNRPVLSGITISSNDRVQMQTAVDNYYTNLTSSQAWFETFIGDQTSDVHLYDNKSYPQETNENNYLTVTYYDNYSFRSSWYGDYNYLDENLNEVSNGATYHQPDTENTRVIGHITGTKTKVLDGGVTGGYTWLKGVTYYDDKYRPVQTLTDNYKGGVDRLTTVYDFIGKALKTKTEHSETAASFKDIVAVAISGNKMICTAAPTNWGFSGLASVEQLGVGQNGWVEAVASETNFDRAFGLSQTNNSAGLDIGYAIRIASNGTLMIYEGGTLKHNVPGTYVAGDVLRVERSGSTVVYKKNGTTVYTSLVASTSALLADVAFRHAGATLVDLKCSFAKSDQAITRRLEYDHAGRLLKIWHKLNEENEILLALNEYNELGQLVDKKLHSTVSTGADAKQSVDYRYNIRGWLTKMNESDVSVLAAGDAVKDLFGFELAYNNDLGTGNTPNLQYNGNISAMKWSNSLSLGSVKENAYNYTYDPLNRLKTASFREKTTAWNSPANNAFAESGLNYDLNGNITALTRNDKRATGWMDNLVFTYTHATEGASNKLRRVTDNGDDFKGFIDGNAGSTDDYKYDDNGNLTHDLNKGIGTSLSDATNLIKYNYLNLPETVTKGNNSIRYIYDAAGRKLSQVTTFGGQVKQADYVGEFQYENSVLQFINHAEGRIVLAKSETILTHDFSSLDNITASTSTLALVNQNSNQTYIRATANGTTTKQGIFPIGGLIPVQPGEQYRIRAKGYRTGSNTVHLYIRTNSTDLSWPGAQLANGLAAESYTEQVVTIPPGHTTLQVGVVWSTVTNGQQFFLNDFEIVKLSISSAPEYQYHIKDVWGNTRLTFTSKEEVDDNTATFETANENEERAEFLRYDNAKRVNATLFDRTNGSSTGYSQRLNGTTNERYGLAKSMMVMPGDVINIEVYAKYVDTNTNNWNTALTNLMSQIAANAAGVVYEGITYSSSTTSFPHAGLLNTSGSTGGPKAYLNYLLFDKEFNYVTGGYKRLSAAPKENGQDVAHERLFFDNLVITEAGYLYIYLSNENETPVEVFFDDFTVEHIESPVVQADDYYPFGLTFNSYKRENSTENMIKFQSQEHIDDLNLGWVQFKWRNHDPVIGRFFCIDPLSEKFSYNSPYAFAENKLGLGVELEGMEVVPFHVIAQGNAALSGFLSGQGIRKTEEKVVRENSIGAAKIYLAGNRETAERFAEESGLPGLHNGPADALRHSTFSALMTRTAGEKVAKELGDAHEEDRPEQPLSEKIMDLHNNSIGRQVALDNPDATVQELVSILVDKIKNGELKTIDSSGGVTKSSATDEQVKDARKNIKTLNEDGEKLEQYDKKKGY